MDVVNLVFIIYIKGVMLVLVFSGFCALLQFFVFKFTFPFKSIKTINYFRFIFFQMSKKEQIERRNLFRK